MGRFDRPMWFPCCSEGRLIFLNLDWLCCVFERDGCCESDFFLENSNNVFRYSINLTSQLFVNMLTAKSAFFAAKRLPNLSVRLRTVFVMYLPRVEGWRKFFSRVLTILYLFIFSITPRHVTCLMKRQYPHENV